MHHYLGIANSAIKHLDGQTIKIKKIFYIIRPLLCALWGAAKIKKLLPWP
ncbi:MAG: nucleotidyltransferase domain-containing protein [Snodgrassella sp.]|nr:nucleotidyltransferase domain-containing protein [Snodgrassella sp.]